MAWLRRDKKQFKWEEKRMNRYVNTSGRDLPVYADSKLTTKVGKLYRDSVCSCIMKQDEAVVVMYRVSTSGEYKVGFTGYVEGAQED